MTALDRSGSVYHSRRNRGAVSSSYLSTSAAYRAAYTLFAAAVSKPRVSCWHWLSAAVTAACALFSAAQAAALRSFAFIICCFLVVFFDWRGAGDLHPLKACMPRPCAVLMQGGVECSQQAVAVEAVCQHRQIERVLVVNGSPVSVEVVRIIYKPFSDGKEMTT